MTVGCMAPGCRTSRQTWWPWLTNGAPTPALSRRVSRGSGCAIAGQTWKPPLCQSSFLWGILANVQLSMEREDSFVWRWTADGTFSAKSTYGTFFPGTTVAPVAPEIWRSRAPYSCKFFTLLAARNRCWMEERLQRRGLPHPAACPLCDQEPETIQHLLLGCVVAREVWAWALARWAKME
jgi:hypothetical protein